MNSRNGNVELFGDFPQFRAILSALAYCFNNLARVLGGSVSLSTRHAFGLASCVVLVAAWISIWIQSLSIAIAGCCAATIFHIFHVLLMRSEVQVIWPDTRSIIASMEHIQSICYRAMCQFVSTSMSQARLTFYAIIPLKDPVPGLQSATRPEPTVGLVNVEHKPFSVRHKAPPFCITLYHGMA